MEATQASQAAATPTTVEENLTVEQQTKLIIVELEKLDRSYFGKDRVKTIKAKLEEAVAILDTKPIDLITVKKEKAELMYLRGKVLDFLPEYTKQAEDLLSKALKLMPSKREAWDALGHVYWKKNDIQASKKCFEGSLEQDENNKEVLRNLSMVNRAQQESDIEKRKNNYKLSIQLATKACALDMKDSQSWYVLGNAHFTNFFMNNESIGQLELALKAYAQTEKNMTEPNPDLYFNRGTILEYLERYTEAIRDFNFAHSIDTNLQADRKASRIIDYCVNTSNLVTSRKNSNLKKTSEIVKSIPTTLEGELRFPQMEEQKIKQVYKFAVIGDLSNGVNTGAILAVRIVMHLKKEMEVPVSFLMVDSNGTFAVVSFYNTNRAIADDKIQAGDLVYIKNPQLIFTSLEFKGRLYSFQNVKASEITDVLVNSQPLFDNFSQSEAVSSTFA